MMLSLLEGLLRLFPMGVFSGVLTPFSEVHTALSLNLSIGFLFFTLRQESFS